MPTKKGLVSQFSIEVEYCSLALAIVEVHWVCMLFCDLYITLPTASVLKCDNVSALYIVSNPVFHVGTKHIEVDCHFVLEKVLNPDILIKYTHDQVAKILIKGLSSTKFQYLKTKLMVVLH